MRCSSSMLHHNGLALVSSVSSSQFRELNVDIDGMTANGPMLSDPPNLLLGDIDGILEDPKFSNLERFNILGSSLDGWPSEGGLERIQAMFPHSVRRGIAYFMGSEDSLRKADGRDMYLGPETGDK